MTNPPADADRACLDDDLVVRARGARAAFAELYDRYYPRVLRYCVRRLFVRQIAEDIVADVFLHIARSLPAFAGTTETDFRRWLFRIASNAVNAHLRHTQRRQELWEAAARERRLIGDQETASAIDMLDWPAVYHAILELQPREQNIITLRYFADLSHDEIGAIVGAQAGAVRTALSRILDRLRSRLGAKPVET